MVFPKYVVDFGFYAVSTAYFQAIDIFAKNAREIIHNYRRGQISLIPIVYITSFKYILLSYFSLIKRFD